MVDKLENELKDLKAQAYDMDSAYAKYKQEMEQKIAELSNKIAEVKGNINETVVETSNQQDTEVVENVVEQEPAVVENNPVITPEEQQDAAVVTPIGDNPEVSSEPNVVGTEAPIQEVTEEPVVENAPLIQPEVEEVKEEIPGPQQLEQTPLTPVGVEIPTVEETTTKNKVANKIDSTAPKAILINEEQNKKLRASKELQESLVFENKEATVDSQVVEIPTADQAVVTPVVSESTPTQAVVTESKEEINKQLESMFEQLRTVTDESKANEINNQISVLTKKLGEAA